MATRLALALSLAPLTLAAQQVITVGQGLSFLPNTIYPAVGDTVKFEFLTPGHSVVAGSYDKPCTPASNTSFYSGILDTTKTYTITINDTTPLFIYCAVAGHCQAGMVGVINPSSDQTLSTYRSAALSTTGSSTTPPNIQGGVISAANAASSTAPSSTPSSTTGTAAPSASPKAGGSRVGMDGGGVVGWLVAVVGFFVFLM